jgi:gas vesicle protein
MEVMTMSDTSDSRGISNTGATLLGFALGAVVGAGLALLMAPDSGTRTRQRLASTARRWSRSAGDTIDQARDTMAELGTDAKSAIKAGQEAFLRDREPRSDGRLSHAGNAASVLDAVKRSTDGSAG